MPYHLAEVVGLFLTRVLSAETDQFGFESCGVKDMLSEVGFFLGRFHLASPNALELATRFFEQMSPGN